MWECYIEPGNDEIQVESGHARRWLRSTAYLAVPNPNIREGDIVVQKGVEVEDGMRVFRVLPYGKTQMQTHLTHTRDSVDAPTQSHRHPSE